MGIENLYELIVKNTQMNEEQEQKMNQKPILVRGDSGSTFRSLCDRIGKDRETVKDSKGKYSVAMVMYRYGINRVTAQKVVNVLKIKYPTRKMTAFLSG